MTWKDSAVAWLRPFLPIALLAIVAMLFIRYAPEGMKPWVQKPGPVTIAQPPKEVVKWRVKTVEVPGPARLVVLNKAELATALKMPELASLDNGTHVLSAVSVPRSAGSTTAVTTLSPDGHAQTILRQEPTPFFELKREFQLSGRWLLTGVNQIEAEVVARPLRIGPVELEAGAGVEVRRENSTMGFRSYVGAVYKF